MSLEPVKVTVKAYAKVNLYLEVLGRRPDGYHEIRSVLVPVSLHDVVTLERAAAGIETSMRDGTLPGTDVLSLVRADDNLTNRAARSLQAHAGVAAGVRIVVKKNIPIGGGLGGGSADAAAVLTGLNDLWQTNVPRGTLMELGARLGCDVPALVHGGAVTVTGVGDRVEPLTGAAVHTSWWMVIVNPGFGVSTRDMYQRYTPALTSRDAAYRNLVCAVRDGDLETGCRSLLNDLQATAFRKYPLLGIIADRLGEAGARGVLMSGSGASVFGLVADEAEAQRVAETFRETVDFPVWCRVAKTMPDGVMVAHGPLEARV